MQLLRRRKGGGGHRAFRSALVVSYEARALRARPPDGLPGSLPVRNARRNDEYIGELRRKKQHQRGAAAKWCSKITPIGTDSSSSGSGSGSTNSSRRHNRWLHQLLLYTRYLVWLG